MADLIDRQALLEWFNNWSDYDEFSVRYIVGTIKEQPSADAVNVVRCKDCKWFNDIGCSIRIVDDSDKPTENDYCSFGERGEQDG